MEAAGAGPATYLPRLIDPTLQELHASFPAVLITGPRACGKTTTAQQHVAQVDRLDEAGTAAVYRLDPDAALRRAARPLLIDEFQLVPEVLAAVKRAVDADPTPGQFLLTGSARSGLDNDFAPATGRVIHLRMQGLVEREVERLPSSTPGFLQRLVRSGVDDLRVPAQPPYLDDYLVRALRSGFPHAALHLPSDRLRRRWLSSYVDNLVTRDAELAGESKDPAKLRAYLHVLALNTAGQPANATLYRAAGINQRTATGYDQLLQNLYVAEPAPAWPRTGNRLTALAKAPKRYLLDGGVAAAAGGFTLDDILRTPDLLGRVFDTFAAAQLRAEADLSDPQPRMHHLRDPNGRVEIDLVFDMGMGRGVAIEVKAANAVDRSDAKHLRTLRDDLGTDFLAGAVLYSGSKLVDLDDRIYGVPLCSLWT